MSELRVGSAVEGTDGPIGRLRQLVVDPVVNRVADLVVDDFGFSRHHRAVPATAVRAATYERVDLALDREEAEGCPEVDLGRHGRLVAPGSEPGLERLADEEDVPLVVIGSGFPVVDSTGEKVGEVDEWWVASDSPADLTHAVVVRSGGLRLDHYVVVPVAHFYLDPAPQLVLNLTDVDLDALPHEPVLPGVHLSGTDTSIDVSAWTPTDPDEAVARARIARVEAEEP